MRWLENVLEAMNGGEYLHCPCCGSLDTGCSFAVVDERTRMGHGTVWCNCCRRGMHLSRMKVPFGAEEHPIPKDISFF